MSKSNPSAAKFLIVAAVTLLAGAAGLAAFYPFVPPFVHKQSARLTRQASADGGVATADYRLAIWLNPANQPARLGLAAVQITAGGSQAALATLRPAGEGSVAEALRVRALIETNQAAAAVTTADKLTAENPTTTNIELAALAHAVANRP